MGKEFLGVAFDAEDADLRRVTARAPTAWGDRIPRG
jgi:hypothetical protein